MMVLRSLLGITLSVFLTFSCSSAQREIPSSQLQQRSDGLSYAVNEDVPYTGTAVNKDIMSGQRKSVQTYKDGLLNGMTTRWRSNGQKKSEEPYENGKMSGISRTWDEAGKLSSEVMFKAGLRDGLYIDYYSSGQKRQEVDHVNDEPHGHSMFWYSNGRVRWDKWYENGELDGDFAEWYEDGTQQAAGAYAMGRKIGKWTTWYENGNKAEEGEYSDGLRTGLCVDWYENGTMRMKATYVNGDFAEAPMVWNSRGEVLETGLVSDVDGNNYGTVKIGDFWWTMQNLKVTHYRNNDPITFDSSGNSWKSTSQGAYCTYERVPDYAKEYGLLYNFYAVKDPRGLAPAGWHVATQSEWESLTQILSPGTANKLRETGAEYWGRENTEATNETGFSARAGGSCSRHGKSAEKGKKGCFWAVLVWQGNQSPSAVYIRPDKAVIEILGGESFNRGMSVRCVKD